MFFILLLLLAFGKAEIQNVQFALNSQNNFDSNYRTLSKQFSNDHIFGYSPNKLCTIRADKDGWSASLQNAYSLENFASTPIHLSNAKPEACFEYQGNSFMFYSRSARDEMSILRGLQEKISKNFFFHALKFDHIAKKLYLIKLGGQIFEVEMEYLDQWWQHDAQSNGILKINRVGTLPNANFSDFFILAHNIYFISEGKIYKNPLENNQQRSFIKNINDVKFNFALFEANVAPNISQAANGGKILIYLLYFLDLIVVFLCAYVLKRISMGKGKRRSFWSLDGATPTPLILQSLASSSSMEKPRPSHGEPI